MALAGVATAANYHNLAEQNPFSEALTAANYKYGMDYTLTFNITSCNLAGDNSGIVLTLAKGEGNEVWELYSQSGRYIGLDYYDGVSVNPDQYTSIAPAQGVAAGLVNGYAGIYTYDDIDVNTDGWFLDSEAANGIKDYTISITGNYAADTTVLTFAKAGKNTVTVNVTSMLDANDFNIGTQLNVGSVAFTATGTPAIPEPATATLSLLALCGLASRRRRK